MGFNLFWGDCGKNLNVAFEEWRKLNNLTASGFFFCLLFVKSCCSAWKLDLKLVELNYQEMTYYKTTTTSRLPQYYVSSNEKDTMS